MIVIPAIDLLESRVVRLRQGRFDDVTFYEATPVELARRYAAAGASWLHVVDLEGSRAARPVHGRLLGELAGVDGLSVQVGGGLRTAAAVRAVLVAGASRAVVGSLAVHEPETFEALLGELGPDRLTLAADVRIDAEGIARIATGAWTETETLAVDEFLDRFVSRGLRHVLCTDIGRDGMLAGPNLQFYATLRRRHPSLLLQASGGVACLDDLAALGRLELGGAIVGRALLEERFTIGEALSC